MRRLFQSVNYIFVFLLLFVNINSLFADEEIDVLEHYLKNRNIKQLIEMVKNKNEKIDIRYRIVDIFKEEKYKESIEVLKKIIKDKNEEIDFREYVINRSLEISEKEILPYLINMISDKENNVSMKCKILYSIKYYAPKGSLLELDKETDSLIKIMEDKDEDTTIRKYIVPILGRINTEKVIISLIEMLDNKNLKHDVFKVISKFHDDRIINKMFEIVNNKNEDQDYREKIAMYLGRENKINILPVLREMLKIKRQYDYITVNIIHLLGELHDKEAILLLKDIVNNKNADESLRAAAVESLAEIAKEEAIPYILQIINDKNEKEYLRRASIYAISRIGDDKLIPILDEIYKKYNEIKIYGIAKIDILSNLKGNGTDNKLLEIIRNESNDRFIRHQSANKYFLRNGVKAKKVILETLQMIKIDWYKEYIIEFLENNGSQSAITILEDISSDMQIDINIRAKAVDVLGKLKSKKSIPKLLGLISDSRILNNSIIDLLINIDHNIALNEILKMLNSEKDNTREEALILFKKIADRKDEDIFINILRNKKEKEEIIIKAIEILSQIRSIKAVPELINIIKIKYNNCLKPAISALGEIGSEESVPYLIEMLDSKEERYNNLKKDIVLSLAEIGNKKAIDKLLDIMMSKDKDNEISKYAMYLLSQINNYDSISRLEQLLNDENEDVKINAVYALKRIGGEKALPGLLKALDDKSLEVRSSVFDRLDYSDEGGLGDYIIYDIFMKGIKDENEDVRISAIVALASSNYEYFPEPRKDLKGKKEIIEVLENIINDEKENTNVKCRAIPGLIYVDGNLSLKILVKLFKTNKDSLIKSEIIENMRLLQDESLLIEALNDENENVRLTAIKPMKGTSPHSSYDYPSLDILEKALSNSIDTIRCIALMGIIRKCYRGDNEEIIKILNKYFKTIEGKEFIVYIIENKEILNKKIVINEEVETNFNGTVDWIIKNIKDEVIQSFINKVIREKELKRMHITYDSFEDQNLSNWKATGMKWKQDAIEGEYLQQDKNDVVRISIDKNIVRHGTQSMKIEYKNIPLDKNRLVQVTKTSSSITNNANCNTINIYIYLESGAGEFSVELIDKNDHEIYFKSKIHELLDNDKNQWKKIIIDKEDFNYMKNNNEDQKDIYWKNFDGIQFEFTGNFTIYIDNIELVK